MPKKTALFLCSCAGTVLIFSLAAFNLNSFLSPKQVLGARTEAALASALSEEKFFWEDFLIKNPSYLDGWLQLAKIEYRLGDLSYATGALNTAKGIAPNSEKVKLLEKEILGEN